MEKFLCANNSIRLPNEIIKVSPKISEILKILNRINVIVAGPGLGNGDNEILTFLWKTRIPLVLRC